MKAEDIAIHHLRDAFVWAALSLGITASPNQLIAGLFLAFAGGYLAMVFSPETTKREPLLLLMTALLMGVLSAIVHPKLLPDWPLQAVMFTAGFGSRFILSVAAGFGARAVERTDDIADGAINRAVGKKDDK